MRIYLEKFQHVLRSLMMLLAVTTVMACGDVLTGKDGDDKKGGDAAVEDEERDATQAALSCGESSHNANVESIRMKDLNTMVKSVLETFGAGTDRDTNNGDVSIFEKYRGLYPSFEGTDFSDTVADTLSRTERATGLVMAQAVIARNVALQCQRKGPDDALCACGDEESAAAMLNRALPYRVSCVDSGDAYVAALAKLCKDDQVGAISALASSLAFMVRN